MCIIPMFAETWGNYIKRIEEMDYRARNINFNRSLDTWSYDELGAVYATFTFLKNGYSDIITKFNGSNEFTPHRVGTWRMQLDHYTLMEQTIIKTIIGFNVSARRSINDRYYYWINYLQEEGNLIKF